MSEALVGKSPDPRQLLVHRGMVSDRLSSTIRGNIQSKRVHWRNGYLWRTGGYRGMEQSRSWRRAYRTTVIGLSSASIAGGAVFVFVTRVLS